MLDFIQSSEAISTLKCKIYHKYTMFELNELKILCNKNQENAYFYINTLI